MIHSSARKVLENFYKTESIHATSLLKNSHLGGRKIKSVLHETISQVHMLNMPPTPGITSYEYREMIPANWTGLLLELSGSPMTLTFNRSELGNSLVLRGNDGGADSTFGTSQSLRKLQIMGISYCICKLYSLWNLLPLLQHLLFKGSQIISHRHMTPTKSRRNCANLRRIHWILQNLKAELTF